MEKLIGFDATEDHRAKSGGGTYAVSKGLNLCPEKGMPVYADRYDVRYPLREQGIVRERCREIIEEAGLPIPPKSACFICPASKEYEISRLAQVDPAYYCLSIAVEVVYRMGHHFLGDRSFKVKAKHKHTGEKVEFECEADSVADARYQFRAHIKDLERPYQWQTSVNQAVGGLMFGKPWMSVPAELPEEYRQILERFIRGRGHSIEVRGNQLPVLAL